MEDGVAECAGVAELLVVEVIHLHTIKAQANSDSGLTISITRAP